MQGLTVGALAKETGISRETVRYYERLGLLPEPARTVNGYRQFSSDAVQRISFIKRAQRFGFTLSEIAELLILQFESHANCGEITEHARTKVAEVEEKIADLVTMRDELLTLIERCGSAKSSACTALIEEPDNSPERHTCGIGSVPTSNTASQVEGMGLDE